MKIHTFKSYIRHWMLMELGKILATTKAQRARVRWHRSHTTLYALFMCWAPCCRRDFFECFICEKSGILTLLRRHRAPRPDTRAARCMGRIHIQEPRQSAVHATTVLISRSLIVMVK